MVVCWFALNLTLAGWEAERETGVTEQEESGAGRQEQAAGSRSWPGRQEI